MKRLKHSFLIIIILSVSSCGHSKKEITDTNNLKTAKTENKSTFVKAKSTQNNPMPFFKATGADAKWSLQLSANTITFSRQTEDNSNFTFPLADPILAADTNIKLYRAQTEIAQINIKIVMKDCVDANAKTHPYTVSIDFKQNTETNFTVYHGCGEYITDYRLHDIWVLETIADEIVNAAQFAKELPSIEINSSKNSFMGYAGCNTVNGSIFSEQSKIRFTKIATTRKMCLPENKEAQFIKALERTTQFKIENNRLYLSNPDGNTLTLKKVD